MASKSGLFPDELASYVYAQVVEAWRRFPSDAICNAEDTTSVILGCGNQVKIRLQVWHIDGNHCAVHRHEVTDTWVYDQELDRTSLAIELQAINLPRLAASELTNGMKNYLRAHNSEVPK